MPGSMATDERHIAALAGTRSSPSQLTDGGSFVIQCDVGASRCYNRDPSAAQEPSAGGCSPYASISVITLRPLQTSLLDLRPEAHLRIPPKLTTESCESAREYDIQHDRDLRQQQAGGPPWAASYGDVRAIPAAA